MSGRIRETFSRLSTRAALVTYVSAGDPNIEATLEIMHSMVKNGSDIIELGVPFSDPMADGPVIQAASERALSQGVRLLDVLSLVEHFRSHNQETPVVLMGYLNPIYRLGIDTFAREAARVGVDGVLTVDCPLGAMNEYYKTLKNNHLDCIFLISPTTAAGRIARIAKEASGFVYYVSRKGVTGSATLDVAAIRDKMAVLKEVIHIPIGVGFGISSADDVAAMSTLADAVIVGSRLVRDVAEHPKNAAQVVGETVASFRSAILARAV